MKKYVILLSINLFLLANLFAQERSSNSSSEVGETPSNLSVSLTGAATYTVPIKIPQGINGVKPQIALVYNSQSGNGTVGYGWNISGVSSITRIPATKFHDGFIDGVDLDASDRFALDGQRLILKSGTSYGADGAVYETENYSNVKVVSHGVSQYGGPDTFTVYYPDGSYAVYGKNAHYAQTPNAWMISRYYNPQDLYISYGYVNNSNNNPDLSYIAYGSKRGEGGRYLIFFRYNTNRIRQEISYIPGYKIQSHKLLTKIEVVKADGTGLKNYFLEYDTTHLNYQRLVKITEKNGDNSKALNPLTFEYDNINVDNANYFEHITSNVGMTNARRDNTGYISGDFNGDAKMDLIAYPTYGINSKKQAWAFINIDNGGNNTAQVINFNQRFTDIFPTTWVNQNNLLMQTQGFCAVFQSINKVTFKVYRPAAPSSGVYLGHDYDKIITDFPTVSVGTGCDDSGYCGADYINVVNKKKYLSGDFNGDGLTDVMAIDLATPSYECDEDYYDQNCIDYTDYVFSKKVYFIDLNKNLTTNFWNFAGELDQYLPHNNQYYKIETADFNGDGKTDFMVFMNHKVRVYTLNSSNHIELIASLNDNNINLSTLAGFNNSVPDYTLPIMLGDFNGDRKIDFVIPEKHNSYKWFFYFSTGEGFVKKTQITNINFVVSTFGSNIFHEHFYIANDLNGDGKTDILSISNSIKKDSQNHYTIPYDTHLVLYENSSISTTGEVQFNIVNQFLWNVGVGIHPIPVFLNMNQNNYYLEFSLLSKNKIHYFKSSYKHQDEVLLRKATNSNGVQIEIEYSPLVDQETPNFDTRIYRPYRSNTSPYGEVYPNINIKNIPNFMVVGRLKRKVINQPTIKQVFSYYGAISNVEGLGFLGFKALMRSNWYNNDFAPKRNVSIFDTDLRGAVTVSYVANGLGYNFENVPTNYVSKTVNQYTSQLSPTKVFKLRQDSSIQYDGLHNTSVYNSGSFDSYNNPVTQTTIVKEGSQVLQTTNTHVYYEHNPNGGSSLTNPYYIGRVNKKMVQVQANNDTFTTEEQFAYDNQMRLIQHKEKGYNTDFLQTNYNYDIYGNILQKKVTPPGGGTPRITNYTYDASHRFIAASTDIEGLTTQYTYDSWGNLLTETDPYNRTTQHQYDSWGKILKDIDYLGKETTYQYQRWSNGYNLFWVTYPQGQREFKLLDPLGRTIKEATLGIRASWDYIKKDYDIYDRLIKQYEPFDGWNGWQNALYTTYDYDTYGRPIKVVAPNGKITTFNYSGLSVTVNDGGKIKTTVKNALDQVVRVNDDGGTITYSYYANGKLKYSYFNHAYTRLYYDGWGRKTKIEDPSAGTYTYTYNAWGEITVETTPNGNIINTYDNNGKIIRKIVQGNTYLRADYTYDTNTKLLTSINGNGNGNYQYTYDNYKRPKTIVENINGNYFKKEFYYDSFGRAYVNKYISKRGNNQFTKVIKTIFSYGTPQKILDNNTQQVLWQLDAVNVRGQITQSTFGNGLKETSGYDNFGFLTHTTTTNSNGISVANMSYNFNTTKGLLTGRTNDFFGLPEHFEYDNLDRLIQYTERNGNQAIQVRQDYNAPGTIHSNKIGKYQYENIQKPYQNTAISDLSPFGQQHYENYAKQTISYNAFKAPVRILERDSKIDFRYNIFQQRSWQKININGNETNKYYSFNGEMEIKVDSNGQIEHTIYIGGDGYSAPVIARKYQNGEKYLYLHRDYLGSIIGISDQNGQMIEKRAFDAWGSLLSLQNGQGNNLQEFAVLDRGYTGHEHLFAVGLIHMNARLYDPLLHRFLAPDNYVQDPYSTQNFNRYGYVLNNPLKYNDPSGELFWLVVGVAALIGGTVGAIRAEKNGMHWYDGFWRGALVGAVGGALSMVGGGTFFANVAWGAFEGMLTGGLDAVLWGYDVGKGMINGALMGAAFAAITSGIEAYGNYKNGHGFRTDVGVIKHYTKLGEFDKAISYVQNRYGMTGVSMKYDKLLKGKDYGITDPYTGNVSIGPDAFESPSLLKATIVHEYGHSVYDRILDANGNFVRWRYQPGSYHSSSSLLAADGPIGYAQEIYNSGRLHIALSDLRKANPLWFEWSTKIGGSKWFHLIPRRFSNPFNLIKY